MKVLRNIEKGVVLLVVVFLLASLNTDPRLTGLYLVDAPRTRTSWFGDKLEIDEVRKIITQINFDGIITISDRSLIRVGWNGIRADRFIVLWKTSSDAYVLFYPNMSVRRLTIYGDGLEMRPLLFVGEEQPCIALTKVQGAKGNPFLSLQKAGVFADY